MYKELEIIIRAALNSLGMTSPERIVIEYPDEFKHGDYSTSVALALAKTLNTNPIKLAETISEEIKKNSPNFISRIEVAGPGFINFFLTSKYFEEKIADAKKNTAFGSLRSLDGKKIMVEYTDPNPFKAIHIGHLMSNAIGESVSRLIEFEGAEVKRVCYQGDVGLHVAKALWPLVASKEKLASVFSEESGIEFTVSDLESGRAYVYGNQACEKDEAVKKEIVSLNKKIYEGSDLELNKLYKEGKESSLESFEKIYELLGTQFDLKIFESEVARIGVELVNVNRGKVFEESDGAVVFKGEKFDPSLHTRVFLNSEGLPTYEAKELGLAKRKEGLYPFDVSITVTGNEIKEYFKVVKKAMESVIPELEGKIVHLPHGMLRLPSGKMSSRTGKVVSAMSLIEKLKEIVQEKIKDREFSESEREEAGNIIAVSAIKYSILRSAIGSDIVFDFDKSISFEGDSGPYLQYSYTRAKSVLRKAKEIGIDAESKIPDNWQVTNVERLISRFPEICQEAQANYSPHKLATYLMELSGEFNSWYANVQIVAKEDGDSPYKIAIAEAFSNIIKTGLWLLGIRTLEKM